MLRGTGSRSDPIALEDLEHMGLEDGEITDDDSDSDSMADLDMYDAEDMMINVEISKTLPGKSKVPRAEVMFTIPHAVSIYREMQRLGFPLQHTSTVRFGAREGAATPDSVSYISFAQSPTSRPQSHSSATSLASRTETSAFRPANDYVFDWGRFAGSRFLDVPETYLRTIGGQLDIYEGKHPGLREAFDYHRPGQARTAPPVSLQQKQSAKPQAKPPPKQQPPKQSKQQAKQRSKQPQPPQHSKAQSKQPLNPHPNPPTRQALEPVAPPRRQSARNAAKAPTALQPPSENFIFAKGPHKGKKIVEVPENYLRTLEGMPKVVSRWTGFKEALLDFNERTGRKGRT